MNISATCFYCSKNFADPKFAAHVSIYQKQETEYGIGLTGLKKTKKFLEKKFTLNRCESCYKIHSKVNRPAMIFGVIVVALCAIYFGLFTDYYYLSYIISPVAGIVAMLLYIALVYRRKIKKLHIKDQYEFQEYPPIKLLLEQGWEIVKPN